MFFWGDRGTWLAPLLFLLGCKRTDDNNVRYWAKWAPLTPPLSPPSATSLFEKSLHMFMAHACGMTMDSPYKSQQDHRVFQILVSEDSCWQNDSGHIYFGQGARPLSGKLIRENPLSQHTHTHTAFQSASVPRPPPIKKVYTPDWECSTTTNGIFFSDGRFDITHVKVEKKTIYSISNKCSPQSWRQTAKYQSLCWTTDTNVDSLKWNLILRVVK